VAASARRTKVLAELPDCGKYCHKSLLSKKFAAFVGNIFCVKIFPFLKYQLSVMAKKSILHYLLNEYINFSDKIQLNITRCELSF